MPQPTEAPVTASHWPGSTAVCAVVADWDWAWAFWAVCAAGDAWVAGVLSAETVSV